MMTIKLLNKSDSQLNSNMANETKENENGHYVIESWFATQLGKDVIS